MEPTVGRDGFGNPRITVSLKRQTVGSPTLQTFAQFEHCGITRSAKLLYRHAGLIAVSRRAIYADSGSPVGRHIAHAVEEANLENAIAPCFGEVGGGKVFFKPHIQQHWPMEFAKPSGKVGGVNLCAHCKQASSNRSQREALCPVLRAVLATWAPCPGYEVIRSFTAPLGFLGVLAAPLIGGVFPILLLVASRAKGDRPTRCCYFSAVAERGLLK
jgi:hypothetical protein